MKLSGKSEIFVPDGLEEKKAVARTTHMVVAAHQDDIELMAYKPVEECFHQDDKWLLGVVATDGAGSPRTGLYASCTDEDMKRIRVAEQKKAAYVGEYGALVMLGHSSNEVKNEKITAEEIAEILRAAKPRYLYTHNPADKHETHVAVAVRVIEALRLLKGEYRPEKLYGCECWRDLDWLGDDEKVRFVCDGHPNLAASLICVHDSQVSGGKRYDIAINGRRAANATFSESHGCDNAEYLSYAVDMTELIDGNKDIAEFICGKIDNFKNSVKETLEKFM